MTKFLVAGLIAIVLAGVGVYSASAANEARVRVIHSSPDAPAVDVYANGSRVLSNVPYKASSGYLSVPAGPYKFEVYAAGTNPATSGAVLTVQANLAANTDYTVIALDSVSQIKGRIFVDNNAAPAAGKAHINVIHAGQNAPSVDVALAGGAVLVPDLGFGEKAGPLPVDAGTYDLEVRVAGTSNVALPLPGVKLDSGVIYTFVATGFLGREPALTVVAYTETAGVTGPGTVTPPSAGDGGLLHGGGSSLYLLGAVVLVAGLGVAGVARKASVRN